MIFEEALREELASLPELAEKVFFLNAKEGTLAPYIICVSSDGAKDKTLQGYLESKEVPCEINVLHPNYTGLKSLTSKVIDKLLSFQGRSIGTGGPFIKNVTYEKPVELYEAQINMYRSVFDITVKF